MTPTNRGLGAQRRGGRAGVGALHLPSGHADCPKERGHEERHLQELLGEPADPTPWRGAGPCRNNPK